MKKYYLLFVLVFGTIVLHAQHFDRTRLDSLFALLEKNQKGMGSVSVFYDGEEVYQKSIGFADVENGLPADAQTKYRIGSISKTFTAAIIMQLVDEAKLSLDMHLAAFFPEIENAELITIAQLLRHRSGIYNFTNVPQYTDWMEQPKSRLEMVEVIRQSGSEFSPGTKAGYSNSNYVLLSLIIEKITNKEFAQVLHDRISSPLGLKNTYFGSKISPAQNEAMSYTLAGNSWVPATETDMSIPLGAGAIVSTPGDLNRFFHALFTGNVVSPTSLMEMQQLEDHFGLGLFQMPFYERQAVGHTGGIDGFQSNVAYFQKDKVSVAYLTNGVSMTVNDILIGVLSLYFGRDYDLPQFTPFMQLTTEQLDKYLGVYASDAIPLKITISKNGNTLIAQATGQSSFPLDAYDVDKFQREQIGLKLQFFPAEQKMTLMQSGMVFEFVKE
ncbi:MAG: beta-lactamase family protein [Cyclobacteriaceae bacterium]|nr:beta-lactamase family protein [Cyclobacteriaceae bacterium]